MSELSFNIDYNRQQKRTKDFVVKDGGRVSKRKKRHTKYYRVATLLLIKVKKLILLK